MLFNGFVQKAMARESHNWVCYSKAVAHTMCNIVLNHLIVPESKEADKVRSYLKNAGGNFRTLPG